MLTCSSRGKYFTLIWQELRRMADVTSVTRPSLRIIARGLALSSGSWALQIVFRFLIYVWFILTSTPHFYVCLQSLDGSKALGKMLLLNYSLTILFLKRMNNYLSLDSIHFWNKLDFNQTIFDTSVAQVRLNVCAKKQP